MFPRPRSKKKKIVHAIRTSIGWIIPKGKDHKSEKDVETQKQESRKAYSEEINARIKKARGLGHRFSSIFRGRSSSTIQPAEILKIQRDKENRNNERVVNEPRTRPTQPASKGVLESKVVLGRHSDQGASPRAPSRRSSLRLVGLGQDFVYKDYMPYYIDRLNRWETFDSMLRRANKWIKDNQLQILTLETLLIPAGNLPGHDSSQADKFVSVETLRIWYDKNQTLQQSLRETKRELPKTLFSSHYYAKMSKKSCFLCC